MKFKLTESTHERLGVGDLTHHHHGVHLSHLTRRHHEWSALHHELLLELIGVSSHVVVLGLLANVLTLSL